MTNIRLKADWLDYHEAAHSAFFAAVGWDIDYATTVPSGELRGHVKLKGDFGRCLFQSLVGDLVGHAAEEEICGIYRHTSNSMDTQDLVHARQQATLIDAKNWDTVYRGAKEQAKRFVKANRMQIEALADLLARHGKIWGRHIEKRLSQLPPLRAIPKKWNLPLRPPPPLRPTSRDGQEELHHRTDGHLIADAVNSGRTAQYLRSAERNNVGSPPKGYRRITRNGYEAFEPVK